MIVLEQCRIDSEGKHLIIEAVVENLSYYKDVYIDSVIIDDNNTYSPNGPSDHPVFIKHYSSDNLRIDTLDKCNSVSTDESCKCGNVYTKSKEGTKRVYLCLDTKDLNLSSYNESIFFVYIIATGVPSPCTPCGMDNIYTMGVAVNLRPIYNMAMGFINELDSSCSIPRGFIDMILRLKAFELSMKTGNYPTAFKYWNKLFKDKVSVSSNKWCGCNGIN